MKFGVGQPLTRKEDDRLIRGSGRYIADFAPADCGHAVVVRSPHAHARFAIADKRRAESMPGVRVILTGPDIRHLGLMPCVVGVPGQTMIVPPCPVLAQDEVHHVGDAVAFVVADTLDQARDAAEALSLDWEPLPHVIGAEAALADGAKLVWPDRPGNLAFEVTIGDARKTESAFAKAAHIVSVKLVNQRLVTNYLDTRGVVAQYDAARDHYTLTLGSQGSHAIRDVIGVQVMGLDPQQMRVITPDVGGGFGTKLFPYREYALAAVAAQRTGKPVKWVADRTEHFLGDTQGRDNITTARLALDADGRFLALDVDTIADMGAYLSTYAPFIPYIGAGMLPGVYDIPACFARIRAAYTNTVPVDAYRGAGRPEASYVIERLVDAAARETGIAPDALRRLNFIRPEQMPYRTATGKTYDTGEFDGQMTRALDLAEWRGFPARAAKARERNLLRGIGLATYIEACGGNGPDTATLSLERDGTIRLHVGTQTTGQGHDTAFSQIIADHLRVPPERVMMLQGDTERIETGTGTGGSSSIPAGGNSVAMAAEKLAAQLREIAADLLEAAPRDLEFSDGAIRIAGTDRAIALADLADHAKATPEKLRAADAFVPKASTYPNGTHVVEVEIDEATGHIDIVRYVIVDDFGVSLNPLLLEGQVHGGTVQGIGQALMEETVYDSSGQLITASLMDYALPRAADMPVFTFETRNVPCKSNPLGAKGAGEAGAIGSCPAVMNAILDALWRAYGIDHLDMPATPQRVWHAIQQKRASAAA
ncbi:xanthine dehydrogenase family protein molybdopterin-binding subunit [Pseudorhodoplanes sp.]|uniref:xanthine dehydrogenase family protein molybdopterin-binding subunit n=1 Tax=Pseudorhodoplanes sp. TaxID=1934341 RepID=UPI002C7E4AE9|nr:xanthine dehydrogenase family protein molybdopterin-binding subunit [Pseudorhodoplanes sp.]HWV41397.1 xanthine dehydrogenase family protein molybdopterin-binding subunit [Pseudorhodoplanes sp.]